MSAGRLGWQWVIDPDGHRWRVEALGVVVAYLRDEDGVELGVGKSVLREHGWRIAEFELAPTNGSSAAEA